MPLYDYQCPHGHRFEHSTKMADIDLPVACEGRVTQLQLDQAVECGEAPVLEVPCALKATMVIAHSNPGGALGHGTSNNRDAAREGRYDPLNPNRNFMAKGRGYRK